MSDQVLSIGTVVWVGLHRVVGSEQAGVRPAVVVSAEPYNSVVPNLAIVVPVTTRDRRLPHHVALATSGPGLARPSFAMTEQVRTIDKRRIRERAGRVGPAELAEIELWLRDHFGFGVKL